MGRSGGQKIYLLPAWLKTNQRDVDKLATHVRRGQTEDRSRALRTTMRGCERSTTETFPVVPTTADRSNEAAEKVGFEQA